MMCSIGCYSCIKASNRNNTMPMLAPLYFTFSLTIFLLFYLQIIHLHTFLFETILYGNVIPYSTWVMKVVLPYTFNSVLEQIIFNFWWSVASGNFVHFHVEFTKLSYLSITKNVYNSTSNNITVTIKHLVKFFVMLERLVLWNLKSFLNIVTHECKQFISI